VRHRHERRHDRRRGVRGSAGHRRGPALLAGRARRAHGAGRRRALVAKQRAALGR
jgi:hypothetical protein